MTQSDRRVVITGMGLVSPLGNTPTELWDSLSNQKSGIAQLERVPTQHLSTDIGGEALEFDGHIDQFGPLEKMAKRNIKKGSRLMCREIQMGVAAAQLALAHSGLNETERDPTRIGAVFGSDYIITEPVEFVDGVKNCLDENGNFNFKAWADSGLEKVNPKWLLKYLPNMPASHVSIYNDLRGPSNSITVREASANLALAEATTIIQRGSADMMVAGSTGSRIHPLRTLHVVLQEQLADRNTEAIGGDPEKACRPFDKDRNGMVLGEGAGIMILEELAHAEKRGATIYGEVIGYGSSSVANKDGVGDYRVALENVIKGALETSGVKASELGHVHAHGLSSVKCDSEEAAAISNLLGDVPVTAAKSYMGNLGAGSGAVEAMASVLAMKDGTLFPTLNVESLDDGCKISVVTQSGTPSGDIFMNLNVTPQGQASSLVVRKV